MSKGYEFNTNRDVLRDSLLVCASKCQHNCVALYGCSYSVKKIVEFVIVAVPIGEECVIFLIRVIIHVRYHSGVYFACRKVH